jgi:hypothetical protein
LEVKLSPTSNITINQSPDEVTAEAEFNLWEDEKKNHQVSIYKRHTIQYGKWLSSAQFVYNLKNSYLFNLGLKNFELLNKENRFSSLLFSAGALTQVTQNDITTWGGVQSDFNSKAVQKVSLLLGGSYRNINGVLNFNMEKAEQKEEQVSAESDKVAVGQSCCSYKNSVRFNVESKVNDDLTVYSSAELTSNLWDTEVTTGGVYSVDPATSLRLKIKNDYSGVVSLTRAFKNNFHFTFATAFNYVKASSESSVGHVKTKFGVSLNLVDEGN